MGDVSQPDPVPASEPDDAFHPPPSAPATPASAVNPPPMPPVESAFLEALVPPLPERSAAPFEFTGEQWEYFRIWIVNTFLTLVTFGVYAAWAKVRKKRYLYGSTRLLGHSFDFTAEPKRLLAGNLVVALLFLGYAFFGTAYVAVKIATICVAVGVVPWLVVRALAFNARNTRHRGLSLRYRGKFGSGLYVYVGLPILTVISLGGFYPYFAFERKKLALDFLRFGDAAFDFQGRARAFYGIYFRAVLWLLIPVAMGSAGGVYSAATDQADLLKTPGWLYAQSALFFVFFSIAKLQVRANRFNYVWGHTMLNDHGFRGAMRFPRLLKIQVVNALAIVGSLGLALPWATLRTTRYTLSCLEFIPAGSLDRVENFGTARGTAVGDAAADFFGVDIGL